VKYHKEYILTRNLIDASSIFKDLKSFGHYHPLIKTVELVDDAEHGASKYIIKEQPFDLISIKIKYSATVHLHKNTIEYKISGIPFLYPNITFQLNQEDEDTTRVSYNLIIKGIPIVKNILMNKMVTAQNELINSINKKAS